MVESQASLFPYLGQKAREKEAWVAKSMWITALVFQAQAMFLVVVVLLKMLGVSDDILCHILNTHLWQTLGLL